MDPAGPRASETAVNLAKAQRALNRYGDAERTLRAAIDAKPRDATNAAGVFYAVGDLIREQGRFGEARENLEAALKLSPATRQTRVEALIGLADIEGSTRQWQSAVRRFNEALAGARELKSAMLEAEALRGLGDTYSRMGDDANAEPLLRRALAIFEGIKAAHIQYSATLICLGMVYGQEGKRGLAEDAFRRALNVSGEDTDRNVQSTVALQALAVLMASEKRFDDAVALADRAYRITQLNFGENSTPAASAISALAVVEDEAGKPESAETHYSAALQIMRANKMANTDAAIGLMTRHAAVLHKLHRNRDAKTEEAQAKLFRSATQ